MKPLNHTIEQSILKTLAYADVFGWPLRQNEILAQVKSLKLKVSLKKLVANKKIGYKNNFYFLYGRKGLIERRLEREKWAEEKMVIARKAAGWLKIIPSILLVGVSGGLAVGNVSEDDDIDFFIICRNGTLWTTRFWTILLLELLGRRRRPNDRQFKNKICPNMFVDEAGMVVPTAERDIYTAHEIGNLKVMWERENIYQIFLKANQWRISCHSEGSANWRRPKNLGRRPHGFTLSARSFASLRMTGAEKFFRWLQLKYMDKKRTLEKIEPHRLMFHPQDKREEILKRYQQRLKKLKLHYSKTIV